MYSVVIPAHNSASVIGRTIACWQERLGHQDYELLVVENGSSDDTSRALAEIAELLNDPRLVPLHSEGGMGYALRAGIARSHGSVVILSADDLPFGFSDLDSFERLSTPPTMVIGSKAHRESSVQRKPPRRIMSSGFAMARRILTGSRVGDSQGTFFLDGAWVRSVLPRLCEGGFLLSTELVLLAESEGVGILEVPVIYDERKQEKESSVGIRSVLRSVKELMRLCLDFRVRPDQR